MLIQIHKYILAQDFHLKRKTCFRVTLTHEKALLFPRDWSRRKDGGGRMGSKRTESNTANIDVSSSSTKTEQLILTKITGAVTVTENIKQPKNSKNS